MVGLLTVSFGLALASCVTMKQCWLQVQIQDLTHASLGESQPLGTRPQRFSKALF